MIEKIITCSTEYIHSPAICKVLNIEIIEKHNMSLFFQKTSSK